MKPQGVRLRWFDVPSEVRAEIERTIGATVEQADSQAGGFSPGVAARCVLADGRRCFIKTVLPHQNPDSPDIHRSEAKVAAAFPADLGAPALWHVIDDGEWVTLVFEDVAGEAPAQPWTIADLERVFTALDHLAEVATPSPVQDLPTFAERHGRIFDGFRRLAGAEHTPGLDAWTGANLERLAVLEAGWGPASTGSTLVHADVRADNVLITAGGRVVFVDWPHACIGAPWLDKVVLLPSVGLDGGPAPEEIEQHLRPFAGVEPELVDAVVAAVAGYFTYHGLQPAPVGLPTLRAFQARQGDVARGWLQSRLNR